MEAYDVAWDAQIFLELAIRRGTSVALVSYDYEKYFDSFDYEWTHSMLVHLGVPSHLADMTRHLYQNMERVMEKGKALSLPFSAFNGFGQGDVLTLLPALLLVSWQFKVIDVTHRNVGKGAYVDDRYYRGSLSDLLEVGDIVHDFDKLAMHNTVDAKNEFMVTSEADRKILANTSIRGHTPKCTRHMEMLGYTVSTASRRICKYANKKADKAISSATDIYTAPLSAQNKKKTVSTKTLAIASYGTQWTRPALNKCVKLRGRIMKCIWGNSSKMRCREVVMAILNDPTKVDPHSCSAHRAFVDGRRMLRKNPQRFQDFSEVLNNLSDQQYVNGPVHGLARYSKYLGIKYKLQEGRIMLVMPTGAEVDLCTTNLTHLRACIRDACRRAILRDLTTRINGNNPKKKRQDMQGVTANVDLDATTSVVHTRRKCEHIQNPKQFLDRDETGKLHLPIDKPCILDATSSRRHQTIIAGSIQPPHRLKHTRGITTDLCPCAECQGVRCDTLHIFWNCPRWKSIRDPYLQAIERFCNKLKDMPHHLGKARHCPSRAT